MARVEKTLEQRLDESANKKNKFPTDGKADYWSIYRTFKGELLQHVHPYVTMVAMVKDGGFLTDHGPDHITTVIQRASDLLGEEKDGVYPLTPYEIFILLVAIHVHDAGHIKNGRKHHEENTGLFLDKLNIDATEQRIIKGIAKAHGGVLSDGSKDTISSLYPIREFQGFPVRLQFLAAILRFADELSDDQTRGARYLLTTGTLPRSSQIYHAYARSLGSVSVDLKGREVRLDFHISTKEAFNEFGKGMGRDEHNQEIIEDLSLLDEIYVRTYKMYCELLYCMRFFPTELQLRAVNVRIDILDDGELDDFTDPIGYRMVEQGYPSFVFTSAITMCRSELTIGGKEKNGAWLKEHIEKLKEERKNITNS